MARPHLLESSLVVSKELRPRRSEDEHVGRHRDAVKRLPAEDRHCVCSLGRRRPAASKVHKVPLALRGVDDHAVVFELFRQRDR